MQRHELILLTFVLLGCSNSSSSEISAEQAAAEYSVALAAVSDDAQLAVAQAVATKLSKSDWPGWRGPNGDGIAPDGPAVPTKWSSKRNVVWSTPVPGRGHASPTIVGNRIFLATADERQKKQSVVAFDKQTGKQAWMTDVHSGSLPPKLHRKNTHASPTVACDGEKLFASFFHNDAIWLTALDLDGNQLWQKKLGVFLPRQYQYGYAPSPLIYQSAVIVAADYEGGGFLVALDRNTGKQIWKTPRPKRLSYSSPVVVNIAGKTQMLISGCDKVSSYNPDTGKLLWSTPATTMATCGTMVWDGDFVFASGGYPKAETVCVKADGSGKIVWKNTQKSYEQSMLAHDGYVYAVTDGGIAYCWRATDGKEMWRGRLKGPISASPVLHKGNIYLSNEMGTTYVFTATPDKFNLVSTNQLGTDAFATPTISGGKIYIRVGQGSGGSRKEILYCIGQ